MGSESVENALAPIKCQLEIQCTTKNAFFPCQSILPSAIWSMTATLHTVYSTHWNQVFRTKLCERHQTELAWNLHKMIISSIFECIKIDARPSHSTTSRLSSLYPSPLLVADDSRSNQMRPSESHSECHTAHRRRPRYGVHVTLCAPQFHTHTQHRMNFKINNVNDLNIRYCNLPTSVSCTFMQWAAGPGRKWCHFRNRNYKFCLCLVLDNWVLQHVCHGSALLLRCCVAAFHLGDRVFTDFVHICNIECICTRLRQTNARQFVMQWMLRWMYTILRSSIKVASNGSK